jgi:hypothetical protein
MVECIDGGLGMGRADCISLLLLELNPFDFAM